MKKLTLILVGSLAALSPLHLFSMKKIKEIKKTEKKEETRKLSASFDDCMKNPIKLFLTNYQDLKLYKETLFEIQSKKEKFENLNEEDIITVLTAHKMLKNDKLKVVEKRLLEVEKSLFENDKKLSEQLETIKDLDALLPPFSFDEKEQELIEEIKMLKKMMILTSQGNKQVESLKKQ
ncbi:hypothetical protein KAH94_00660 [bacterium]|nr:hypothetical protein [bacterium]